MRTVSEWFSEYGKSHQNITNKKIHWVCVPAIYLSLVGLLWVWTPYAVAAVLGVSTLYYLVLNRVLGVGMVLMNVITCVTLVTVNQLGEAVLLYSALLMFVLAWIGQFIGHKIEGVKPSFFTDLQFLLIGPLWVLAQLFDRLGIRYNDAPIKSAG